MKVVLHAHSTWSHDGKWPLNRIARTFGLLGVDAVMMTEHDTGFDPSRFAEYRAACADASTSHCQLIPGIEYSSPENDIHILTWGLHEFLEAHRPVQETLERVHKGGGVAVMAHPVRRDAWAKVEPGWLPLLAGIELWNRKSDGLCWEKRARELIAESGVKATVGMDFHRAKQLYPLTHRFDPPPDGVTVEEHLVTCLRTGQHRPIALGREVLTANGEPRNIPHVLLERLRRNTLSRLYRWRRRRE